MKKITILACVLLIGSLVYSQNTFPSTGSVGIGTTSPGQLLTVNGGNISLSQYNYFNSARLFTQYPSNAGNNYARGRAVEF